MVWFDLACSQHLAGLPGGRVGGQLALMVSVEEVFGFVFGAEFRK